MDDHHLPDDRHVAPGERRRGRLRQDGWQSHRKYVLSDGVRKGVLTGTEHLAASAIELQRELDTVNAWSDEAADQYYRACSADADAAGKPALVGAESTPCATCGAPATKTIAGKPRCDEHGTPLPIPPVIAALLAADRERAAQALAAAPDQPDELFAEAGRELKRCELDREYEPALAARDRWCRHDAAVRDRLGKDVEFRVQCLGQLRQPPLEEFVEHWPEPWDDRVILPSLPEPGLLLLRDAERQFDGEARSQKAKQPEPVAARTQKAEQPASDAIATLTDRLGDMKAKKGPGPKSAIKLGEALLFTLTEGRLFVGLLPREKRTIHIQVCRDAGHPAQTPRGWSDETLYNNFGDVIERVRREREQAAAELANPENP